MSSGSIGVTNVAFTRCTISWVILSPSCSASSSSRASPLDSGHPSSICFSSLAAWTVFWPARSNRSKKKRSRGTSEGSFTGANLPVRERLGDALGRVAVPFLRWLRPLPGGGGEQRRDLRDPRGRQAEQGVGPGPDRHRALR